MARAGGASHSGVSVPRCRLLLSGSYLGARSLETEDRGSSVVRGEKRGVTPQTPKHEHPQGLTHLCLGTVTDTTCAMHIPPQLCPLPSCVSNGQPRRSYTFEP